MKKIDYTDIELVKNIVEKNDVNLFEVIYDRYAHFVYNKCISFLKDNEEAKDLTQDIFIKIYLNLRKFQGRSKFSTWVYSITFNACVEHIKSRRKALKIQELQLHNYTEYLETDEVSYSELLDNKYECLQNIMNTLPKGEKLLLLMKYQQNLSVPQMVAILNLKESAVKMRLLRVKKKLVKLRTNLCN